MGWGAQAQGLGIQPLSQQQDLAAAVPGAPFGDEASPGADDPPGVLGSAELHGMAALASYLSEQRAWLTPEVVDTLGQMSLRLDEVFDGAPHVFAKDGVAYELKIDRLGSLWEGFDPATDPFLVFLTQEVYSDLGKDHALGFVDGEERVLSEADLLALPALGLALTRLEEGAATRSAQALRLGEGGEPASLVEAVALGSPRLAVSRNLPLHLQEASLVPVTAPVTSCFHEAGVPSCNAQGAMVCPTGSTAYFVLKNIMIRTDHEGLFKGKPEVELFPFNSDAFASLPSEKPTSKVLFHGQWVTDVAGRSRFLPDVNNTNQWYTTSGVALFPFSMANVWVAALWENDNTRGVLDTTESTSATIKFFNTPTSYFLQTFQLVNLGFLKTALLIIKNTFLGDGDDEFHYSMALTPTLACSSGLSTTSPRQMTLSGGEWDMQSYFACINPSCPPPSVAVSGPDFFFDFASGTWSASVSSGLPPFSYSWTKNGAFIGSGSSVSTSSSSSFNLGVTITDSVGQKASTTFFVEVFQEPTCGEFLC